MNAPLSRERLRRSQTGDGERARRDTSRTAAAPSVEWPAEERIALCVLGLSVAERSALERLVAASSRRRPRLELLDRTRAHEAQVVVIDAADEHSLAWSRAQPWLRQRAVIWIGRRARVHGHMTLRRPIAWASLPIVLAEALRHAPTPSRALAPRRATAHAPAVMVLGEDAGVRERLRWLLEHEGRRVTLAASAREGLAALHAAPYGCVILAGGVPDLERRALCARVRALQRRLGRIPLLLLDEGSGGGWDRLRGRLAGFDDVAAMPRTPAELRALLARHAGAEAAAAPPDGAG